MTTALRPFLASSSREPFLNHYRFVGCKGHSLRAFSYFCSWSHSHYWFHSPMYHIWIHTVFYTKDKRISQFKWQSKVVVIQKPTKWIGIRNRTQGRIFLTPLFCQLLKLICLLYRNLVGSSCMIILSSSYSWHGWKLVWWEWYSSLLTGPWFESR